MIRDWKDMVEAICPGQSQHLATAKFLAYPFTVEELRWFLVS